MRLLLTLLAENNGIIDSNYHYHVQGLIYNCLKFTDYNGLHDKYGYKFFCFSNLYPHGGQVKLGDRRQILISSPDEKFIRRISDKILERQLIKVGNIRFRVSGAKEFDLNLSIFSKIRAITSTPLVIRIPRQKCLDTGLELSKPYRYFYWRKGFPKELLIAHIRDNLEKKYKEWFSSEPIIFPLNFYSNFRDVAVPLATPHGKQIIIGSLWTISMDVVDKDELRCAKFAFDCGLGERTSLGFGFINVFEKMDQTRPIVDAGSPNRPLLGSYPASIT